LTDNKKSLISIDIARAIAALGVFFYHQHIGDYLAQYTKIKAFDYIDNFGAAYAVPLFFLISGYCIHLSNLKYVQLNKELPLKVYYKRRFLRIYPPYLVAVIFSILVNLLTHFGSMPTLTDLFVHAFSLQGFTVQYFNTINLVLWTITIEIAFYIIYPIFYYLRLKFSLKLALLTTFIVSCLSIVYLSLQQTITLPQYYLVFNIWFSWCCGAYIADKLFFNPKAFQKLTFKIVYGLILVLFVYATFYPSHYFSIVQYQLKILIWTGPLIYLLSLEDWFARHKSWFLHIIACIGLSSYSLYLLHEPLIAIKNYLVHAYLPNEFQKAGVIIGIIFIPIIAWLSYRYIERPFMVRKKTAA